MKRILLIVLTLLIICLCCVNIFIPSEISVSKVSEAACIPKNIVESLQNQQAIARWWPEQPAKKTGSSFIYQGYNYQLVNRLSDGADILITRGEKKIPTKIVIAPEGKDSSIVEWKTSITSGRSPFKRIIRYYEAVDLKNGMEAILNGLLNFAVKTENVYGFHIERTTFTDTILFATRFSLSTYPSTETIYNHIYELRKKIKDAGAIEKDSPMLHVNQIDSIHFQTMIAICVNKEISGEQNFFLSRMVPMKDRFLSTSVTGGDSTIRKAHEAIENYMDDHFLSAPAIPFEILITDRLAEKDSSKWKTKIFYPSM